MFAAEIAAQSVLSQSQVSNSQASTVIFPPNILSFDPIQGAPSQNLAERLLAEADDQSHQFLSPLRINLAFSAEGRSANALMRDSLIWSRDDLPFHDFENKIRGILAQKIAMPGQVKLAFSPNTVQLSFISKVDDRHWKSLSEESWQSFMQELSNCSVRHHKIGVNVYWKLPVEAKTEEISFTVFSQVCRAHDCAVLFAGDAKHVTGTFSFNLPDDVMSGTLSQIFAKAKEVCARSGRYVVAGAPLFVRPGAIPCRSIILIT